MFTFVSLTHSDINVLSKERTHEIIETHIKYGYYPVNINTQSYYHIKDDKKFNYMHAALTKLKQRGLVEYVLEKTILSKVTKASLTDKGENAPHAYFGYDPNTVGFQCGERHIFEITDINMVAGMVYFTYSFVPNDLGYILGSTKDDKNKGRAKIIFDDVLETFIFKGFEYYYPKEKKWAKPTWAYENIEHKLFYFGIIK